MGVFWELGSHHRPLLLQRRDRAVAGTVQPALRRGSFEEALGSFSNNHSAALRRTSGHAGTVP